MLSRRRTPRHRPSLAGEIDVLDLVLGLGLALGIPFLCIVIQRILEPRLPEDPFARSGPPKVELIPDEEEVKARWDHAEEIYANAKGYVQGMSAQSDPYLKDHYRQWGMKCLQKSKLWYEELESLLLEAKDSQTRSRFGAYLEQIGARKREVDPEIEKLRQLDPHKRPLE